LNSALQLGPGAGRFLESSNQLFIMYYPPDKHDTTLSSPKKRRARTPATPAISNSNISASPISSSANRSVTRRRPIPPKVQVQPAPMGVYDGETEEEDDEPPQSQIKQEEVETYVASARLRYAICENQGRQS
jgi:hypothetical protein